MRESPKTHHVALLIAALVGVWASAALACSVPVFRYGLEHWAADPYRTVVLHRGALDAEVQTALARLGQTAQEGAPANLSVTKVDLDKEPSAEAIALWKQEGSPDGPWLVVQNPASAKAQTRVWSGPLNAESVTRLLDSPARKEIAKRLGEGESAVWVLLDSGNPEKDNAAAQMIEARLDYLAGVMELPKLDEQDIKNGLLSLPDGGLRLAFSLLRIARDDPEEKAFVPMLLATETDLAAEHEPIAFPIFGQGRVLYALVGEGIRHETLDKAASFLIGSCSCQVKEQNPGADLLMAVDWKQVVKGQSSGPQDLPTVAEILTTMPETVIITGKSGMPASVSGTVTESASFEIPYLYIVGLVVFFGMIWILLKFWHRRT